jgi:dTMP kinase
VQAEVDPDRYLVLDATLPPDELSLAIHDRIHDLLPDPVPPAAEDNTGSFPAITE